MQNYSINQITKEKLENLLKLQQVPNLHFLWEEDPETATKINEIILDHETLRIKQLDKIINLLKETQWEDEIENVKLIFGYNLLLGTGGSEKYVNDLLYTGTKGQEHFVNLINELKYTNPIIF